MNIRRIVRIMRRSRAEPGNANRPRLDVLTSAHGLDVSSIAVASMIRRTRRAGQTAHGAAAATTWAAAAASSRPRPTSSRGRAPRRASRSESAISGAPRHRVPHRAVVRWPGYERAPVHRVQLHVMGGSMRRHTSKGGSRRALITHQSREVRRGSCRAFTREEWVQCTLFGHARSSARTSGTVRGRRRGRTSVAGGATAARDRARRAPCGRAVAAGRSGVRGWRRGAAARLQRGVAGGLRVGRVGRASRPRRAGGG